MDNMNPNPTDGATPRPDETPGSDPLRTFLGHQKRALEATGRALDALLPTGFKENSREARSEFAKGVKVLVDAALVEMEKATKELDKQFSKHRAAPTTPSGGDDKPSTTGTTKVKVQVD